MPESKCRCGMYEGACPRHDSYYASVDNVEKEEPPFDYKKWAEELRALFKNWALFKNYDDSGNVV